MSHEREYRSVPTAKIAGRLAGTPLAATVLTLVAIVLLLLLFAARAAAAEGFGREADVTRSDETGKVVFVATEPGRPISAVAGVDAGTPAATAAVGYLREHAESFGIAGDGLAVDDVTATPGGGTAVRTQQLVDGVPVLAGELVVNLTDDNEILSVSGEASPVGDFDTDPALSRDASAAAATDAVAAGAGVDADGLDAVPGELRVYDPGLFGSDGGTALVREVLVTAPSDTTVEKRVLVDADTGAIANVFELTQTALNRRICDDNETRSAPVDCTSGVLTEGGTYSGGVADVQPVYNFLGDTYNFYNARWGRDSIDNAGQLLKATVRWCTNTTIPNPSPPPPTIFQDPCPNYNNAFYSSSQLQMYIGTGVGSDDIMGHELTHGVTNVESGLVYQNESGGINESLSDVFGESVDLTNGTGTDTAAVRWRIGEDSSLGIIRNMANPPAFNDPDKMTSRFWGFNSADNGRVHTNSGVSNKAFFLLVDGQTFNTYTVSPIGLEKAIRIFYEAQTNILTSGSDYGALGNALRQACTNLTGTNGIVAADCTQVNNAVLATEMDVEAATPDTQIDSGPGNTDDPTPTWTFSVPAQFQVPPNIAKPAASFQCSVDTGTPSWGSCSGAGSHTPSSDLADGTYTFRVRASIGSNTDPTPATRDFTVSTADMELVSKTDGQDPAFAGEDLTYTIQARNNGPGTAENAEVVDVLPAGTTYESSSIPCTEAPAGTLTCGLGNLADDESRTFTITATIARDLVYDNGGPLTITNQATADADRFDRDTSNDAKSEPTLVKAKADLRIVSFAATNAPIEMIVGQPANVTLHKVITNDGPSAPMDTKVARTATATANATVSPASTSHVENALDYQELRSVDEQFQIKCTNGGPATFTFKNDIAPNLAADTDPNTANNHAQTSFTVECIVPVAINIHPGSFKNPFNLSSNGVIPVAVLTTSAGEYGLPLAFNATQIKPLTTRFAPKPVVTAGGGAPEAHGKGHVEDAIERSDERTRDGDLDMVLHFETQRSSLTPGTTEACVRGRFGATNMVFQGCDSLTRVP
jgi:uncharacterized repeat protein (TIGR01451 family)